MQHSNIYNELPEVCDATIDLTLNATSYFFYNLKYFG